MLKVHIKCVVKNSLTIMCRLAVQNLCNLPEIIIHPLESSLLHGKGSSTKDWLQVDPLSLDLIQVVEILIQISKPLLPD